MLDCGKYSFSDTNAGVVTPAVDERNPAPSGRNETLWKNGRSHRLCPSKVGLRCRVQGNDVASKQSDVEFDPLIRVWARHPNLPKEHQQIVHFETPTLNRKPVPPNSFSKWVCQSRGSETKVAKASLGFPCTTPNGVPSKTTRPTPLSPTCASRAGARRPSPRVRSVRPGFLMSQDLGLPSLGGATAMKRQFPFAPSLHPKHTHTHTCTAPLW